MPWVMLTRAPRPDVDVWPGRRALALVDAVAWPIAWAVWIVGLSVSGGLVRHAVLALCAVALPVRAYRALACNHRYHFTTWRWGRGLALILAFGLALKLAVLFSA